jgi:hypothetical protein
MSIAKINRLEESIDILVDEHLRLLVAAILAIIAVLGVSYYYFFWPIIDGQPEYFTRPVFQPPTMDYEVRMTLPKRVEPRGDEWYELTIHVRQTQVLTTTQAITANIRSLSPYAKITSSTKVTHTNAFAKESERSFEVLPLTTEPQEFSYIVYLRAVRPASRPKTFPLQVSLAYENVRYTRVVPLHIDYWSRMVATFVSGGALIGILTFAATITRSIMGERVWRQKVLSLFST